MNYYNNVKEQIADYITRKPVKETEDVISAYTLFSAVKEEAKKLRSVREIEKGLLDKLNEIYPKEVGSSNRKLFKKKTMMDYFDGICHNISDKHSEIVLYKSFGEIKLNKDFGRSGVYSKDSALTEEAYAECAEGFEKIFHELEYVGQLYAGDIENNSNKYSSRYVVEAVTNTITCECFDIKVGFNRDTCEFSFDVSLNRDAIHNSNDSSVKYYRPDSTITNAISQNKETILRNTPINMKDLSYMFCMLVFDYINKENEKNIDKSIDEIFQKIKSKKISEE